MRTQSNEELTTNVNILWPFSLLILLLLAVCIIYLGTSLNKLQKEVNKINALKISDFHNRLVALERSRPEIYFQLDRNCETLAKHQKEISNHEIILGRFCLTVKGLGLEDRECKKNKK